MGFGLSTEQLIAGYTPAGDVISLICCVILLFIIAKVLYFTQDSKFFYMRRALHCIMLAGGINVGLYYVILYVNNPIVWIYILRDSYHICLLVCLYCFIAYMKRMLDVRGRFVDFATVLTRILFVAAMVFDVAAPLTHFGFYYVNGVWADPLVSPFNAFYAYSFFVFLIMLVFYSERLIRSVRTCLVAAEIVVTAIMIYQAIININTLSTFTYILPVLVVMLLVHSKPYDDKTGAMNASSFESFLKQVAAKNISVDYMVLKLKLSVLNVLPDELGKGLNSFWHNEFRSAHLFELDSDLFVLAVPRNKNKDNTEEKIKGMLGDKFLRYYMEYQIPYKVICLIDIDFINNEMEFAGILNNLLSRMDDNRFEYISGDKRESVLLFKSVKENLEDIDSRESLEDDRVIAYCQPIRNMRTGKFDTAEALMRLSIDKNTFVRPDVFIPIAEQYGYIHSLTKIMLNKVCRQIKKMEEEGYSFNRISVNFAATEIRMENFCDEILEIIRANGISPSRIGIELTESQTEHDFEIIKNKIARLRNEGMTLYLDDVGTGYSNLDRIVKYDVDVVKFDRFFLLEAERDERVVKLIKHLSDAFKEMNYALLYEGVETEENEQLCVMCGADYIQGFKYSKPVPIENMVDFFEKKM